MVTFIAVSVAKTLAMAAILLMFLAPESISAGRGVDQLPRRLDLGRHVGEHELDRLVGHHGLTELAPFRGVAEGPLEGALGEPEGLGRDAGAGAVEGHHGVLETAALAVRRAAVEAGTRQSSNSSSLTGTVRMPIVSSRLPTTKPGVSFSTMKGEMPRMPRSGSVRA